MNIDIKEAHHQGWLEGFKKGCSISRANWIPIAISAFLMGLTFGLSYGLYMYLYR